MKNIMTFGVMKNMLCCMAILVPLQLGTLMPISNDLAIETTAYEETLEEPVPTKTNVVLLDLKGLYCDTKCLLLQNKETIDFMSKTFGVNSDDVIEDLINRNADKLFNKYNIGALTDSDGNLKEFDSFEKGLIEYLFVYCKENPKKVDNTRTPYEGDADYVVKLIGYFTSIYDNVDYLTAVSIGAAESGYYKVSYMLRANNIYGGMSSNGLIKYKSIEYGVLSYIRLLSNNYYAKGLTTLESIGRVYCPTYNERGQKQASRHWINLVTKAMNYYKDSDKAVSIEQLVND